MSGGTLSARINDHPREYLDPTDFRQSILKNMKNYNVNLINDESFPRISASTTIQIVDKVKVEIEDRYIVDCSCHKEAKLIVFLLRALIASNSKIEFNQIRQIAPLSIHPQVTDIHVNDNQKAEREIIEKKCFGVVDLVEYKGNIYALRTIKKDLLLSSTDFPNVHASLVLPKHPFIAGIHSSFTTSENLYVLSEYPSYGELYFGIHIISEEDADYFNAFKSNVAQVSSAIDFCHSHSLSFGGFSKENILLDKNGNAIITQFDNVSSSLLPSLSLNISSALSNSKKNKIYDWQSLGYIIQTAVTSVPSLLQKNPHSERSSDFSNEEQSNSSSPSMSLVDFLFSQRAAFSKRKARFDSIKTHRFFKGIKWIPNPERKCIIPTAKEPSPPSLSSFSSSISCSRENETNEPPVDFEYNGDELNNSLGDFLGIFLSSA